MSLSRWRYSS